MKFVYEYRTSDNVRHNATVSAPDRDAAFARLKARGIRPSRLEDAPGFFNKLFGKGKRWIAIAVLTILLALTAVTLMKRDRAIVSRARELDTEILSQLVAAGHQGDEINEFLAARRRLDEAYRKSVIEQLESEKITKKEANELLAAVGLEPIE